MGMIDSYVHQSRIARVMRGLAQASSHEAEPPFDDRMDDDSYAGYEGV